MEIVIETSAFKAFPPPPRALSRASSSALRVSTNSQDQDDNTLAAGLGAGARGGEGRRCWHPSQDGTLLGKIYSTMGVEVQVNPAQAVHREEQHGKTEIGQLPASEAQQTPQGPRRAFITPAAFEARSAAVTSADACLSVIRSHQASKLRSDEEVEEPQLVPVRPSAQEAAAQEATGARLAPQRPCWSAAHAWRQLRLLRQLRPHLLQRLHMRRLMLRQLRLLCLVLGGVGHAPHGKQ